MTGPSLAEVISPHLTCSCPELIDVDWSTHITAAVTAHLAAILGDPETVKAVAQAIEPFVPDANWSRCAVSGHAARAAIAVIAERLGVAL